MSISEILIISSLFRSSLLVWNNWAIVPPLQHVALFSRGSVAQIVLFGRKIDSHGARSHVLVQNLVRDGSLALWGEKQETHCQITMNTLFSHVRLATLHKALTPITFAYSLEVGNKLLNNLNATLLELTGREGSSAVSLS